MWRHSDEITKNVLTSSKRNPIQINSDNAKIVIDKYCNCFCEEGQVPWQFNIIH